MQRLRNLCSLHQKIAKYGNSNYLSVDKPMDVPTTGAGDAMAAGLARAIMQKASPREAAHAGLLAATQFLESKKRSENDE